MRATFRFHGEMNDFLPARLRGGDVAFSAAAAPSVKDAIESLGPPHVEAAWILVDGRPAGFGHVLRDGEVLDIHPVSAALPVAARTAPPAPEPIRFLLDVHLRRLATHLRLLGIDAEWRADAEDEDLARRSAEAGRVLLTRDLGLLKRSVVVHGRFVRATSPAAQLAEIVDAFELSDRARPFSRCLRCGGPVESVPKAEVLDRLRPGTARSHDLFRVCRGCGRVYWRGAHHERLVAIVRGVLPQWVPDPE